LLGLPLLLWLFSLLCDVAYLVGPRLEALADLAVYAIVAGLIGAIGAALNAGQAMRAVPASRRRLLISAQVTLDLSAIALFSISVFLRQLSDTTEPFMATLSVAGLSLLGTSAWLSRRPAELGAAVLGGSPAVSVTSRRQRDRARA
jgi:hypothetical protein